jgi:hypothetical protein
MQSINGDRYPESVHNMMFQLRRVLEGAERGKVWYWYVTGGIPTWQSIMFVCLFKFRMYMYVDMKDCPVGVS